jgi:hypothetical protein
MRASPNIIRAIKSRRMRWYGHVTSMEETRNAFKIFVRKREGRRPLGRPMSSSEDNIRIDLGEIVWVWTG